ncbi:MAG: hypothetical protein ACFFG0_52100 [Candidatus Thorarchaeota archaeon]
MAKKKEFWNVEICNQKINKIYYKKVGFNDLVYIDGKVYDMEQMRKDFATMILKGIIIKQNDETTFLWDNKSRFTKDELKIIKDYLSIHLKGKIKSKEERSICEKLGR